MQSSRNSWIPLQAVLNRNTDLVLDDASIWLVPIKEFGLDCTISAPLTARLQILPQEDGLLVRGVITGSLTLPCRLCAEETVINLQHNFDSFEPFPPEQGENDPEVDEYFIRRSLRDGGLEINPEALAWEEFTQALPQYPLCRENCAGLCEKCGHNLNLGQCDCDRETYDPRMSKLRGLKLVK